MEYDNELVATRTSLRFFSVSTVRKSRIKIARNAASEDINLSVQFLLNCGTKVAGSCLGGSSSGAYQFIHETGYIPYDTCQPYLACSSDSPYGFCPHVNTTCSAFTTCRTCTMKLVPSWHPFGEICREIDHFPNATVAEDGTITLEEEHGVAMNVMRNVQAENMGPWSPLSMDRHGTIIVGISSMIPNLPKTRRTP